MLDTCDKTPFILVNMNHSERTTFTEYHQKVTSTFLWVQGALQTE